MLALPLCQIWTYKSQTLLQGHFVCMQLMKTNEDRTPCNQLFDWLDLLHKVHIYTITINSPPLSVLYSMHNYVLFMCVQSLMYVLCVILLLQTMAILWMNATARAMGAVIRGVSTPTTATCAPVTRAMSLTCSTEGSAMVSVLLSYPSIFGVGYWEQQNGFLQYSIHWCLQHGHFDGFCCCFVVDMSPFFSCTIWFTHKFMYFTVSCICRVLGLTSCVFSTSPHLCKLLLYLFQRV